MRDAPVLDSSTFSTTSHSVQSAMSSTANHPTGDQPSPFSRKRPRDQDDQSDFSTPRSHQSRRFKSDYDRSSPRDSNRRRGGGGGGGYQGYPNRSHSNHLSESFLQSLWSLGDSERFDFRQEIPDLVLRVESHYTQFPNDVLKGFRIAAAELPHKLPHFALLISLLAVAQPLQVAPEQPPVSIGLQIIRDLSRAFQLHIDSRRWRSTRLFLHLFGHLHALSQPLVSSTSLLALLRAIFSGATDELTCTGARADECLRIVCEGLLRSGLLLSQQDGLKQEVSELVESIRVHMVVNRRLDRSLFNEPDSLSQYIDPIEELVAALNGASTADVLPVLDEPFRPLLEMRIQASGLDAPYPQPFDLPVVLLPPDAEDSAIDHPAPKPPTVGNDPGPVPLDAKDRTNYLGVKVLVKLFSDNTVPSRDSANGVVLRTLVNDVIDVFEVNRKECAKILLELPRWVGRGTFKMKAAVVKPKVVANEDGKAEEEPAEKGSNWVLEHLILESILGAVFAIPTPPIRSGVYYHSLIAELCRLSPSTVAPGLGKCVRRLYGGLGERGAELVTTRLEPEGIRRFADWFAVHLSNFGFLWAWKDWTEVVELPEPHPKHVFVCRILELEIRLSYFDRIKGTVPSVFLDAELMASEAPGPVFEYENPEHRDHLAALDVIQLLKRKESVLRLVDYLNKMKERLAGEGIEEAVEDVTREVAVQALLNVGSRSFSHFLNVLERYLELLKNLTNSTDSRAALLRTVSKFWQRNAQFELIVIDKLLEYRVVDPIDSLRHAFEARKDGRWGEMQFWDGVKLTVEKVTRRVSASRAKLERLRKAEEDERDVERAAGGELLEAGNGVVAMGDSNMKDAQNGEAEPDKPEDAEAKTDQEGMEKETKQAKAAAKREEMLVAEQELAANVAEQAEVLAEAVKAFSIAREEAERKAVEEQSVDEEDGGSGSEEEDGGGGVRKAAGNQWKAWWLRGWWREFCRSFAVEISNHFEQINERLDGVAENVTSGGGETVKVVIKEELRCTKEWIESIGVQSI